MTAPVGTEWVRTSMRRADTDEAWWAQRAPFIGASTTAALFGEHPFITLAQLARERRNGARQPDNPAMQRGRFLEEAIAQWWSVVHDTEITEAPELYVCNGVLIATLDRLIVDAPAALEVKTTAKRVSEPERYWWWQCQAQLACTGFDRIEVAAFDASMTLQSFTVLPDLTAMARVVDAATEFLERFNAGDTFAEEPSAPDAVELDAHTRELVRALRIALRTAEVLNDDIGTLKGMIDVRLGKHDAGTVNGIEVVRRYYRTVRNALDAKRLREEQPDIAAAYTKEPTTTHYVGLR